jgi:hypothetical protein
VQLVAGACRQGQVVVGFQMGEVSPFAREPVTAFHFGVSVLRLTLRRAIGADLDGVSDGVTELGAEHGFVGGAAVFQRVVQQTSHSLILAVAEVDHQVGYAEQVADIGNSRAVAKLRGMQMRA